ncbi:beta-1,4-endoglucanase, partial [Aphelenchoides avenae]
GDAAPSPSPSPAPVPFPVPAPAPSPPPSGSNGVIVSVKPTNSWQGGAQIDITLTNNGAAKVCGATLKAQKDASTQIQSLWKLDNAGTDTYATPSFVQLAKGQSHTAGAVISGKTPSFSVVVTKAC